MNKIFKAIYFTTVLALCLQAAYAKENIGNPGQRVANGNRVEAADCRPASSSIDLDINDVRAELLNGGDMWWDLVANARYEVPFNPSETQRGPSSLFAGSIWIGGIDQGGQLKVAAATYRQNGNDYFPGPLDATGNTDLATCNLWDHHYQVFATDIARRDSLLALTAGGVGPLQSTLVPQNMLLWPAKGNQYDNDMAGSRNMAPFYDVNGDGIYDPTTGDYPTIYGDTRTQYADQMIWWVYNDKGNIHTESNGEPIGVEVHALAFAYKTNDDVNDMTFYRYTIYNDATSVLDSAFMGQWADPDLGCYIDDYVGCDTSLTTRKINGRDTTVHRNMGIVYNASAYDGGNPSACVLNYGHQPPFLGINYFKGPLDQKGRELGMSSFTYYNNDFTVLGNPQHASNYYGYLSGSWIDGTGFTYGGDGYGGSVPTKYVFPGAPDLAKPAWSECSYNTPAGDRRMVQSSGPFKLEPGATNEIIVGVVWVRPPVGTYPCPSLALLQKSGDHAQALFDSNFKILNGPDAPTLNIVELDQKLIIQLVNTNTPNVEGYNEADPSLTAENIPDSTFQFQGYQVYQLVNSTVSNTQLNDPSQARLVFQCDTKDNVSKLVNLVFDPTLNANVPTLEVNGANAGITHSFELNNDAFATNSEQLVNFQQYYFLAISYATNNYSVTVNNVTTTQLTPYLAGRRNIKVYTAIPHKPAPENGGLAINSNYGTGPEIQRQEGGGNGGNWVQLTTQTVEEILTNSYTNHALYQGGAGPVVVKVVDPKNVPNANFELLFRDTTLGTRQKHYAVVDDTIISIIKVVDNGKDSISCVNDTVNITVLVGGKPDTLGNGEIVIIGGRDSIIGTKDTLVCSHITSVGHDSIIKKKTTVYHPAGHDVKNSKDTTLPITKAAVTQTEPLDDTAAWTLRMMSGDSVVADKSIAVGNEQIIPDWGLSVFIQQVRNPGSDNSVDNSGYIGATITYASAQTTWLTGITNQAGGAPFHWIRSGTYTSASTPANNDYKTDTLQFYANILGTTWAPYALASEDLNYGPGYPDPTTRGLLNRMDSLNSVDIVFTSDTSKWTRCIVVEANPEQNLTEGNVVKGAMRQHASLNQDGTYSSSSVGFSWFPGYAIDPDRGRRLNILFAEDSRDVAANGNDMMWNPTPNYYTPTGSLEMGGRHYIYIMRSKYDKDAMYQAGLTPNSSGLLSQTGARNVYKDAIWTSMPLLASGFTLNSFAQGLIPTTTTIQIRVNKAYQVLASDVNENNFFPRYTFSTSNIATTTNSSVIAKSALDTINVVPNPYYGYAGYEINQLDNRVRITNLPPKCEITIYTLSGTLVKSILRDDPTSTYFDWDLKNNLEVPIASGVYLIHVNADGIGEVTLKWFGVMRPIDLSSF